MQDQEVLRDKLSDCVIGVSGVLFAVNLGALLFNGGKAVKDYLRKKKIEKTKDAYEEAKEIWLEKYK